MLCHFLDTTLPTHKIIQTYTVRFGRYVGVNFDQIETLLLHFSFSSHQIAVAGGTH